ncbi:MAG: LemA family protein [Syntrophaceae bacterium PtaB.Bin095]|jgi:LemA protein|nr:MAG: LemA family protein [Syntrophaceae bacterium PtaB.Bin095]
MVSSIIVLGLVAAFAVFAVSLYNGLVGSRNAVKNAWSSIDVQLKRRHDLIPNVIEAVRGYAAHERQTLDAVIQARKEASASRGSVEERASAENALTRSLRALFALAEAYPNLKANENFIALQEELASTENKIGFARQYYNDAAMQYKNKVEMFPGNIIAGIFHFQAEPFFQMEASGDREVPQVKF